MLVNPYNFIKMVKTVISLLTILYNLVLGQDQSYCNPSLCTSWNGIIEPHIGCPGNSPSYCPTDAVEIEMTKNWIEYIVHKHNMLRNNLAGGEVARFPPARRMPLIVRFLYRII